jgi:hypothetical protein
MEILLDQTQPLSGGAPLPFWWMGEGLVLAGAPTFKSIKGGVKF